METAVIKASKVKVEVNGPSVETLRVLYAEVQELHRKAIDRALIFGTLLNERKAQCRQGEWRPWLEKAFPKIVTDESISFESFWRNCNRWMEFAEATWKHALADYDECDLKLLPAASVVVTCPVEELTEAAQEARQLLFDFIADKTIKEAIEGVVVDGDPAHRLTRAVNGKKTGGYKGEDRKDWALFIAVKLEDVCAHLSHWGKMSEAQQLDVQNVLRAFANGDELALPGRGAKPFKFRLAAEEVRRFLAGVLKTSLKGQQTADER